MNVRGASFLITGASGGIGHATAIELARRGGRLLVCGRDSGALEKVRGEAVALGTTARAFTGDLSSAQGVRALADGVLHSGVVPDVIVNVAGQLSFAPIEAEDAETAERLFRVNVLAPIEMARAFTPVFKKRGSGLIVNVGSIFGSIGFPYFATYSATKFALRGFSEALRRELKDSGVRVSYVAPRATRTGLTRMFGRMADAMKMAVDEPQVVATKIVAAIERDCDVRYLGFPECLFVRINALMPGFVDKALVAKAAKMRSFAEEAACLR
jgi:short-subunit dehydrogenase